MLKGAHLPIFFIVYNQILTADLYLRIMSYSSFSFSFLLYFKYFNWIHQYFYSLWIPYPEQLYSFEVPLQPSLSLSYCELYLKVNLEIWFLLILHFLISCLFKLNFFCSIIIYNSYHNYSFSQIIFLQQLGFFIC